MFRTIIRKGVSFEHFATKRSKISIIKFIDDFWFGKHELENYKNMKYVFKIIRLDEEKDLTDWVVVNQGDRWYFGYIKGGVKRWQSMELTRRS